MNVRERTGRLPIESQALQSDLSLNPEFLKAWNDCGYKIEFSGQNIRVLIFGESHQDIYQQREQIELIRLIKPGYVLHEIAGAWTYDPRLGIWCQQTGRKFDEIDELLKPFLEDFLPLGMEIVGCDLTYAECLEMGKKLCQMFPEEYDYDATNNQIRRMTRPTYGTGFEGSYLPLNRSELPLDKHIMRFREGHMLKMMTKYQKKSNRPIIVVLGAQHIRNIHQNKVLRRRRIGYAYVDQAI